MDAKKVALYFSFVLLFVLGLYSVGKLLDKSNLEYITDLWNSFSGFLITNGPLLFLAITFLPALILPVSPLLALAGIWGESHGILFAATCGTLALVANCFWTYWIARIFGLTVINRFILFLRKKPLMIPEDGKNSNYLIWSLVMRLTPGIPLFLPTLH